MITSYKEKSRPTLSAKHHPSEPAGRALIRRPHTWFYLTTGLHAFGGQAGLEL
ncbi:MAG: hypothetical protein IPF68_15230 [Bacteroidales bacterium]|nr:hypothetical protein [Bacteroidales bacterium]